MKTNKIYKVITIIMILVISIFTFGCGETQEEKYSKLEKKYTITFSANAEKIGKLDNEKLTPKQMWIKMEEIIDNTKKETEPILKEMEKTAKGNEKLEKKTKFYKKRYDYTMEYAKKNLENLYVEIAITKGN